MHDGEAHRSHDGRRTTHIASSDRGALRGVARVSQHAWDINAIEVEVVSPGGTALALSRSPSFALVSAGERLNAMLSDAEVELGAMHALVDAALADGGELAYRGLALARDSRGRTPLQVAATTARTVPRSPLRPVPRARWRGG